MAPRRSFYSRTFLFLVLLGTDSVLSMPNLQKRWVLSELKADTFSSVPVSTVTQVPIASETTAPGTTGSIPSSLETSGEPSAFPFPTETVTHPTPSLTKPLPTYTPSPSSKMPEDGGFTVQAVVDAFQPVGTAAPPSMFKSRSDHPAPRINIASQSNPLSTNKFYANFFLGNQNQPAFTHPYSLQWSKGGFATRSWGLAISHIDANQYAQGDPNTAIPGSPIRYFIAPIGIQSVVFSAKELGSSTVLTTDTLEAMSINVNLKPSSSSSSSIRFPLVQGMGFVTAAYKSLQPMLESGVGFREAVSVASPKGGVFKYRLTLQDGKVWLMYVMPDNGQDPKFSLSSGALVGPTGWSGAIQVAKNPTSSDSVYDTASGVYATTCTVSGSANGASGTYSLNFQKAGLSTGQKLLMFALPHHIQSFDSTTSSGKTSIILRTTTKGDATGVVADTWTLNESNLPVGMGFQPWSPSRGSASSYSSTAINAIINVASSEVKQDMGAQSNLDSMYYSGKALSKFATLIYTIRDIANQANVAAQGLAQLKTAFALFATNQQQFPLVYETAWKGLVSTASYVRNDPGVDFGNSYYNDHHFHYGYFVHAAAIVGYMDSTWLSQNKDWVNALVRDVSNPSKSDNYFPVSRSFDWYHGHSWAKGLFESGDSKDEESSSEDVMFAYALKMWGKTVGDSSMEARGNLMLSVLSRSLSNYFLMQSNNKVQPSNFIANKATGILFENKIDHTTYFGANFEYVEGIHMIPLIPASGLSRPAQFVQEEWNSYFTSGAVADASKVVGGWKGLLYANLALINPTASWNFFNQASFDPSWLDGGATRAWYLAYAAGLGGA